MNIKQNYKKWDIQIQKMQNYVINNLQNEINVYANSK